MIRLRPNPNPNPNPKPDPGELSNPSTISLDTSENLTLTLTLTQVAAFDAAGWARLQRRLDSWAGVCTFNPTGAHVLDLSHPIEHFVAQVCVSARHLEPNLSPSP